ncbi:MAG: outer membrane protein [Mucilaginibacter sp.]
MKYIRMTIALLFFFPVFALAQNSVSQGSTKRYSDTSGSRFFLGTGININQTTPNSTAPYYAAGGRGSTSYKPAVSLGYDIYTNPNTGRFVFRLEAMLTSGSYKSDYQEKIDPYVPTEASFDELWFSFAPQIIYNFYNGEDFKFYGGAGISLTYYKYSNIYYGPQDKTASKTEFNNDFDFNGFDTPLMLKVGFQLFKRFGIYTNYLTPTATTRAGYFSLDKSAVQIGLNYYLK